MSGDGLPNGRAPASFDFDVTALEQLDRGEDRHKNEAGNVLLLSRMMMEIETKLREAVGKLQDATVFREAASGCHGSRGRHVTGKYTPPRRLKVVGTGKSRRDRPRLLHADVVEFDEKNTMTPTVARVLPPGP